MSKHEDPDPNLTPEELAASDEPVHVPKGQSRARFLLILGLMIFTLVIYVVPAEFTQMFRSGNPAEDAYVSWTHPTEGAQSLGYRPFMMEKRRLQNLLYTIGQRATNDFIEDEQTARIVVLDRLANDAGIQVTDSELRQTIRDGGFIVLSRPTADAPEGQFPEFVFQVPPFGDAATLQQALERAGMSAVEFQETLRKLLRIERYESLLSIAAQPRPEDIETAWKKQHQEFGFEFVSFDVAAAEAEVATATADEAVLRTWFDGLDLSAKRAKFSAEWVPERVSAELLLWNTADTTEPVRLLEKFALPPELDIEGLAKDYYNQFANVRFRRSEENTAGATAAERLYLPFEEVADKARREARIHRALIDYSADVQNRLRTGVTSDQLAIEAAEMGLAYIRDDDPRTQADWSTYPGVGDATLADSILRASRADRTVPLYVGATHMVFGRTLGRVEAGPPAFEAVAERALAEWRKDQAFERVNARANELYSACRTEATTANADATAAIVDGPTFAAKAQALGLAVVSAGWIDESKLTGEEAAEPTETDRFLRELAFTGRGLLRSADSEVSAPLVAFQKDRVYVARKLGQRDPEKVTLEPREFEQIRGQAALERARAIRDQLIGLKGLETRYGLSFPGRTPPPEAPAEPKQS